MKAVIVDLRGGQAAALREDGRVVKLSDAGYSLGQVVDVREAKRRKFGWGRALSAVAAAAVLLMALGGGAAYAMPYGVVSLDAEPSIEYTINRFDYVLSVEGVNEEGQALLESMDRSKLLHRPIGDALEASVAQLEAGDRLDGEILISAGTKREDHAEKLLGELESGLCGGREQLRVRTLAVSEEELGRAREAGMSAGRHRMVRELGERQGESVDPGDWADRPIRELMDACEGGSEKGRDSAQERPAFAPRDTDGAQTNRPEGAPSPAEGEGPSRRQEHRGESAPQGGNPEPAGPANQPESVDAPRGHDEAGPAAPPPQPDSAPGPAAPPQGG